MPEIKRKNAKQVIETWDKLFSERSHWETHWADVTHYCLPHKENFFNKRTSGAKLPADLYDSVQIASAQIFAAGIHGYMTNPASRWFELGMRESQYRELAEVKTWLKQAEHASFDSLNQSNFNQEIHELYIDFGTLGTGIIYEEEDPKDDIRFFARPLEEVCIAEDKNGRVILIYRKYPMKALAAYDRFGKAAGKTVVDAMEKNEYNKTVWFIHAIEPRFQRDFTKEDNKNMPWASIHVNVDDKIKVNESGYHEFPAYAPRYSKTSGDTYGYSAAMVQLPNIKMLQEIGKALIKGARKMINPSLVLPHDGYLLPFRTGDGAINYKLRGKSDDTIQELGVKGNIPVGRDMQEDYRMQIKQGFFVDLFLTLMSQTKQMTVPEVQERIAEKMLILGPVIGRIQNELLSPLIERTVNILIRRGRIPPPPEVIAGKDYKITYISPLAKAQRAIESNSIVEWMAIVREMADFAPQVIDLLQVDKIVDRLADIKGIDPDLVTDKDTLDQMRRLKQQLEGMAQEIAMLQGAAKAASDMGGAEEKFAKANATRTAKPGAKK